MRKEKIEERILALKKTRAMLERRKENLNKFYISLTGTEIYFNGKFEKEGALLDKIDRLTDRMFNIKMLITTLENKLLPFNEKCKKVFSNINFIGVTNEAF